MTERSSSSSSSSLSMPPNPAVAASAAASASQDQEDNNNNGKKSGKNNSNGSSGGGGKNNSSNGENSNNNGNGIGDNDNDHNDNDNDNDDSNRLTRWPESSPLEGEELIFSISCGNSHLHWATHFGDSEDFNPQIFWRTPHLNSEEMSSGDLLSVLSRNLPDDPHDHIFGKSASDATSADAVARSNERGGAPVSVYVVSTNDAQERLLAEIWKTVPSRLFVMRGDDFFGTEQGRYDTMGTDRLATLTGAVRLHGHPALVFDGGTATTYSATDCTGSIMGGGIGPGLQSKFRSLAKDTAALPAITSEEVIARVNEAQEKGRPLPTFARNTTEAMMADAFQEFAFKGRNVVNHWIEKAYNNDDDNDDKKGSEEEEDDNDAAKGTKTTTTTTAKGAGKFNADRRVVCTGGDGDILMQLLQPHYGGVIEHMDSPPPARGSSKESNNEKKNGGGSPSNSNSKDDTNPPRYRVESSKHLIHYGIASVLERQTSLRRGREAFDNNPHHREHVGERVAKLFPMEADDGDNVFRGKVVEVVQGGEGKGTSEPEFRVRYDDGDSEDVSAGELFDMFKLYAAHGEKKAKKKAAATQANKGRGGGAQKKKRGGETTTTDAKAPPTKERAPKSKKAPPPPKEQATKAKKPKSPDEVGGAKDVGAAPRKEDVAKKAATPTREGAKKPKPSGEKPQAAEKEGVRDAKPADKKAPAVTTATKVPDFPMKADRNKKSPRGASSPAPTGGGARRPVAKKARTVNDIAATVNSSDPESFVRGRVAKNFDSETYYGTIMEYDDTEPPAYWHVEYDDGDEEDYSKKDLIKALKHYEKTRKGDANKSA